MDLVQVTLKQVVGLLVPATQRYPSIGQTLLTKLWPSMVDREGCTLSGDYAKASFQEGEQQETTSHLPLNSKG